MSFILDALRKSEHARQRQTGPGLAEVPVAPAKSKTNVWATAAVALLVVNLLAVGVLLLRRAQKQDDAPAVAASAVGTTPSATPATTAAPTATAGANEPPTAVAGAANPALRAPPAVATARPPALTQSPAPVAQPTTRNPLADEVGDDAGRYDPSLQAAASAVPYGPPAVAKSNGGTKRGSVVYAPVPEATDLPYTPPAPQPGVQAAPRQPAADALPGADEMTARGGLPALHLDLHVYATQPQQRFVFVNSRKYREGDTLAEGPVVEQITQAGAVLNFRGSRFTLSND